ncbi:MAG: nucleotidyltransferase family protein [Candidatus Hydrogenedentes bacterium]|nr:nucleotidyltransferase family protein [Candidatus Hydrogenedentota bacterium]
MTAHEREMALDVLRRHKQEFARQYGVTQLGVFGSVARGDATPESDVDVVVQMTEPDLFSMVHMKDTLEESLHRRVDIVRYREEMNAFLKKWIDREAVYV